MSRVFVVAKSHDCSDAKLYGELVYLTSGVLNPYAVSLMASRLEEKLKYSQPTDWLLLNGLPTAQALAVGILAAKHGRVRLLMFRKGKYVEREVTFNITKKEQRNE